MKKIAVLMFATIVLTSCGGSSTGDKTTSDTTKVKVDTTKVVVKLDTAKIVAPSTPTVTPVK
jgi:ABC-type glycerol-3-phosphate transport system substrate-binding protein